MKIKTIKTHQELEGVRLYWEKWQNHINNDFEHFKLVCQVRPEVECPWVTVIEQNGRPHALIAGRLERTQIAPPIGYLRPVKISAKVVAVIHQGVLGQLNGEAAEESIHYFWSLLSSGVADAVEFHYLAEQSPLRQAVLRNGSRWFCEKGQRWSVHREMILPAKEGFIGNKMRSKHRSWIRKKQRELESAFSGRMTWRWMNRFDDVPGLCARLEEAAARTYQRGLGSGFFDNEEYRQRFALYSRRGQLRVQLLEIDGRIGAFWFGVVNQGVFHSSETGYDPALQKYEVGTQIFIRMADELVREGVQKLDFGIGDASYKQRFGDHCWEEATIWMFAPTAKGIALRTILRLSIIVDSVTRRMLQRARLIERLKTSWRRSLTKIENEADRK